MTPNPENSSTHRNFDAAARAVLRGDLQEVTSLLEDPSLAKARTAPDELGHENTLLHLVTGMGEVQWTEQAPAIATLLIDRGADVDAPERSGGGETPLIHAVSINNVPVAEILLKAGADTEATGRFDGTIDTALGYALFYGTDKRLKRFEEDCPELLIRYGARVCLPFAAGLGRSDLVADLLGEAESEDSSQAIQQALIFACQYGHAGIVGELLDRGADVNAAIDFFHVESSTALGWASHEGHDHIVRLLRDRGATR